MLDHDGHDDTAEGGAGGHDPEGEGAAFEEPGGDVPKRGVED